jgi:hypothetical protein
MVILNMMYVKSPCYLNLNNKIILTPPIPYSQTSGKLVSSSLMDAPEVGKK